MSKKQAIILFFSTILLMLMAVKPLNYFCRATNLCEPIILSYYLPQKTGQKVFDIIFETKSNLKQVKFKPQQRSTVIKTNKNKKIAFKIENLSQEQLNLRPKPYVMPKEAKKYIEIYNCLCQEEQIIKPQSSKTLTVHFKIDRKIEKDPFFEDSSVIRFGYELK